MVYVVVEAPQRATVKVIPSEAKQVEVSPTVNNYYLREITLAMKVRWRAIRWFLRRRELIVMLARSGEK